MPNEPIRVDYLTVTWTADNKAEAVYPHFYARVYQGAPVYMRGYRGWIKEKLFFGRSDDRFMLQATSSKADVVIREYDFRAFTGCSFARVDLQLTVEVPNADTIILQTRPPKPYRSTLTYSLSDPGATLYVGAPSSRARLRLYNKSAESGVKPDPHSDYLRVELQLRDLYADRAATYYYADQCAAFFRAYIAKMADAFILDLVDRAIGSPHPAPPPIEEPEQDWIARRYAWLEDSVKPAIVKLALVDPQGVAAYIRTLIDKLDVDLL